MTGDDDTVNNANLNISLIWEGALVGISLSMYIGQKGNEQFNDCH